LSPAYLNIESEIYTAQKRAKLSTLYLALLLLIALKMQATPNADSVMTAKIAIPTGHPQLKKA
jgi:hypothetical protein